LKRIIDPNPTSEELGFESCPECDKMFYEQNLYSHMKEDHPDSVNDYTWSDD